METYCNCAISVFEKKIQKLINNQLVSEHSKNPNSKKTLDEKIKDIKKDGPTIENTLI